MLREPLAGTAVVAKGWVVLEQPGPWGAKAPTQSHLDAEFGGHRLLAASGPQRWRTLTRAALADGTLDAGLLVRWERLRPQELQSSDWIAMQLGKIYAALDRLEDEAETFGPLDLGLVGVGCALGYLPLRVPEIADRARWPRLFAWYERMLERPSFSRTVPVLT